MSLTPILSDFFLSEDVKKIFNNKYIIFIGDSVNRSMYKDMVKLYQKNEHLTDHQLKLKGEPTFENDRLLEGGQFGTMSNDTTYTEVREFRTDNVQIRFYFVTRCNSSYLQNICKTIQNDQKKPDVVIMNSCYWDLSRYGPKSVEQYKINLQIGIRSLLYVLPKETVFIWTAALPVSEHICGGFMGAPGTSNIDQKVRLRVRENAIEANRFAAQVANDLSIDFLDLHYFFKLQQFRRAYDGIHWDATAHRRISNLLLHHLCDCWDLATPGRFVVSVRDPTKMVDNKTENESIQVNKEVVLKEVAKELEDDDDGFVVIKVVEGNKEKKNDDANDAKKVELKVNEESKITEEKINKNQAQTNVISSYPSSPSSSTSSIENRLPKEKFKMPPKTSVTESNDNKKQRRETNNAADNTISNRQIINNSIPNQNFYQNNAYNFTDNMHKYNSYNLINNPNPFYKISYDYYFQHYYSNSVYKYTLNSCNNYFSSNQSRYISKYKLVNKRN